MLKIFSKSNFFNKCLESKDEKIVGTRRQRWDTSTAVDTFLAVSYHSFWLEYHKDNIEVWINYENFVFI